MADWYYTTNKQQIGPVSKDEFEAPGQQGFSQAQRPGLAGGMGEWVRASSQGFRGQEGSRAVGPARKPARARRDEDEETVAPPPRRRATDDDDDKDDDLDDGGHGAAGRAEARGACPVGAKVG